MTSIAEETAATGKPRATKKARVGAQGAHVTPKKGMAAKKSNPAKKAPKAPNEASVARNDSKAAKVLEAPQAFATLFDTLAD